MTKMIKRVYRGGCWDYSAWDCRSAYRDWNECGGRYCVFGFRPAFRLKRIKR